MTRKKVDIITRGMTTDFFIDHFKDMVVYFDSGPKGVPIVDSDYIAFYLQAPDSAVTHIGVVDRIERDPEEARFFLKAIIKLDKPIVVSDHAVRKHEYNEWTFERLGIKNIGLVLNDFKKFNLTSIKI